MLGLLKGIKFLYRANKLLLISSDNYVKTNFIQLKTLMLTANHKMQELSSEETTDEETKKKRTKTVRINKITLENPDGTINVVLLDEANKIAKRNNMFLIEMPGIDTKSGRKIYKLVDHTTYIKDTTNEDKVQTESKKDDKANKKSMKTFTLSNRISQHDLDIKLNHMNKLLEKKHLVYIIINCSANSATKEDQLEYIKKKVKGTLDTETIKKNVCIFLFRPLKNKICDNADS